jgi:hypothetical protein
MASVLVAEPLAYVGIKKMAMDKYIAAMQPFYGDIYATYYDKSYMGEPCIVFCEKSDPPVQVYVDSIDSARISTEHDYKRVETKQGARALKTISVAEKFVIAVAALAFVIFAIYSANMSANLKTN